MYLWIGDPPTESLSFLTYRTEYCDTFTSGVPNLNYDAWSGRAHLPMNVKVAVRSCAYDSGPTGKAVIYDMVVTNIGASTIQDGYVGFYFDADVHEVNSSSGYDDDLTGTLPDDSIAYIIDDDGELYNLSEPDVERAFAFKFLKTSFTPSAVNYNWWVSSFFPELDFGPRQKETPFRDFGTGGLGTPEGDRNKYYILSHEEWDYDQIYTAAISPADPDWMYPVEGFAENLSNGYDTRFLMSVGPFNLAPDASERVIFTTFTGENVHVNPNNAEDNLYGVYAPSTYRSNLDFSDVVAVANSARDFVDNHILKPLTYEPSGLKAILFGYDSVRVEWDPWVFDDVTGYDIYLTEIPPDSMPHPGAAPPWLRPETPVSYDIAGPGHRYTFYDLDSSKAYFVNISYRTAGGSGFVSDPAIIDFGWRPEGVTLTNTYYYLFVVQGDPAALSWNAPAGTVDHYNVYKITAAEEYPDFFMPFYDDACYTTSLEPSDSFDVDGAMYYYFAMEPYAQVPSGTNSYEDYTVAENDRYAVTYVDDNGLESLLSNEIVVKQPMARNKEILVLTYTHTSGQLVHPDTIKNFYDLVLEGYDYDIYNCLDSLGYTPDTIDWHLLTPYELVILDDGFNNFYYYFNGNPKMKDALYLYKANLGRVAYFGALSNNTAPAAWSDIEDTCFNNLFGIDSAFIAGIYPYDSTLGFIGAGSADTGFYPLNYDRDRYPFDPSLAGFWPEESVPGVVVFAPGDSAEVIHSFRAKYAGDSPLTDRAVGLKCRSMNSDFYAFGFHLWYMKLREARTLIKNLTGTPGCCIEMTGNINCSLDEAPDISDITRLIDFLYLSFSPLCCPEESDIDGSGRPFGEPGGDPDISDVTRLIDYLYLSRSPIENCR